MTMESKRGTVLAEKRAPFSAPEHEIDDVSLVDRVIRRENRAWEQLVRRFQPALRALLAESGHISRAQIDDVLGDLWLKLLEDDMRRLRAYAASRAAPFSAWLAMQATQVAFQHAQRSHDEPEMVPLDRAPEIADTRRPPPPAPRMMRVEDIAERWDLNVKTIYGMIERGELAARRCGRVIRVPRHVVESFEQASVAPERSKMPCR
jgi:excisionase family DNA binding protein